MKDERTQSRTRSYRASEPMIAAFDRWRSALNWGAEEAVVTAIYFLMGADPKLLGPLRVMYNRWASDGCPLDDDGLVPDKYAVIYRINQSDHLGDMAEKLASIKKTIRGRKQDQQTG